MDSNRHRPYPSSAMGSWHNGNFPDSLTLDENIHSLRREVSALEREINVLNEESERQQDALRMLRLWGGIIVTEWSETKIQVEYHFYFKGKFRAVHNIGFIKTGTLWSVDYYDFPFSLKNIEIAFGSRSQFSDVALKIAHFRHCIDMCFRREDQFREAKELEDESLHIYPSKNTLTALIELKISDRQNDSGLSEASITLLYKPDKFLPEKPTFNFRDGDKASQEDFEKQLKTLECMPLKEALLSAFHETPSSAAQSASSSEADDSTVLNSDLDTISPKSQNSKESSPRSALQFRGRGRGRGTGRGRGRGRF